MLAPSSRGIRMHLCIAVFLSTTCLAPLVVQAEQGSSSQLDQRVVFEDSTLRKPYPYHEAFSLKGRAVKGFIDWCFNDSACAPEIDIVPDKYPPISAIDGRGDSVSLDEFTVSLADTVPPQFRCALSLRIDWTGTIWRIVQAPSAGRQVDMGTLRRICKRLRATPAVFEGYTIPFAVTVVLRRK
jgi:hypothetical protein